VSSVSVPIAMGNVFTTGKPTMTQRDGSIRIRHRELLFDSISGSTTFTAQALRALNPGLTSLNPWLAAQAQRWEEYCYHKLSFIYQPIAPTTTAGVIIISPSYDVSDPTPTTEVVAANARDTVIGSCFETVRCDLDPKALMALGPRRFIRDTSVAGDQKTYDCGMIRVFTNNQANANPIGKLWIDYDVELFVPDDDLVDVPTPEKVTAFSGVGDTGIPNTALTDIDFDVLEVDGLSFFPPPAAYSSRPGINPPRGYYRIDYHCRMETHATTSYSFVCEANKNGVLIAGSQRLVQGYTAGGGAIPTIVEMVGTALVSCSGNDQITFAASATNAGGTVTWDLNSFHMIFTVV
jgi:hypothetical protein